MGAHRADGATGQRHPVDRGLRGPVQRLQEQGVPLGPRVLDEVARGQFAEQPSGVGRLKTNERS